MNTSKSKLPVIIDLQPEPAEPRLRLPGWMRYLFLLLYACTLLGLGLLLKEGYGFFKLYQAKVQALRIADTTAREIAALNEQLQENRRAENNYEQFKHREHLIARPGPLLDWLPSLVGRSQRAQYILLQQASDRVTLRFTIEKPISEPMIQNPAAPAGYQLIQSDEETPKFQELPANQKPGPKNEYSALVVQLKKQ